MTARAKCSNCGIYGPVNWTKVNGKDIFECAENGKCEDNKKMNHHMVQDSLVRQIQEIMSVNIGIQSDRHGTIQIKDGKLTVESSFFNGRTMEITF